MNRKEIIESISSKGNGEIYLGVVGAVRSGKSTFIKKFIETLVVPNIEEEYDKKRCLDEIPQTAQGKTIMTIEPKFVPSSGANIKIDEFSTNIKLVDCVGYIIDGALGYTLQDGSPRMIKTPWFEEEIPFEEAASIGTEKVIKDHSTIGIVITTDGSFGEFNRDDYINVEEKIVNEMKSTNKPFIIIMNTTNENSNNTSVLCDELKEKYSAPVIPLNIEKMDDNDAINILREALDEFPVEDITIKIPGWINALKDTDELKKLYINKIKECVYDINKLRDIKNINTELLKCEEIEDAYISNVDTINSTITISLKAPANLFEQKLKDIIGVNANSKSDLIKIFEEFSERKNEYDSINEALKQVKQTGYGIAFPKLSDMKLEKPEIIKQAGRYGIKLKAIASSIHMIKVDVESTFEPIIGSELQSKELIDYLMKDEKEDPNSIWKSEIFGRSLDVIVQEGIQAKLSLLPESARYKLGQTITKMVNKGSNNLIAIVI